MDEHTMTPPMMQTEVYHQLTQLITYAIEKPLCTKIFCSTCGAHAFRDALKKLLNEHLGEKFIAIDQTSPFIHALRQIPCTRDWRWIDPMRYIVFQLRCYSLSNHQLQCALEGSWAGEILEAMIAHHTKLQEKQDAHEAFNHPDAIAERRAKKRDEKQLKHEAHLKRQRERAIWWHQNNPPPAAKVKGA